MLNIQHDSIHRKNDLEFYSFLLLYFLKVYLIKENYSLIILFLILIYICVLLCTFFVQFFIFILLHAHVYFTLLLMIQVFV